MYPVKFSLAEKERQEQKVNGLTKALEGAEEKYETACQEVDRVKAELAHTETECVLCAPKSMLICAHY